MQRNIWLFGLGLLLVAGLTVKLTAQGSEVDAANTKGYTDTLGSIRGVVVDTSPKRYPVPGAHVEWMNPQGDRGEVVADEDGNYRIGRLKPGQYALSASQDGYADRQGLMVFVVARNETLFDIKMRPMSEEHRQPADQIITCRGIRLMDDTGKVRAFLGVAPSAEFPGEDVIRVFNDEGIPVAALSLSPDGGWLRLHANEGDMRAEMRVDKDGALTRVYGKDTKNRAGMSATASGGVAAAYSGSAGVTMSSHSEGGTVTIDGQGDRQHVALQSYPDGGHLKLHNNSGETIAELPNPSDD